MAVSNLIRVLILLVSSNVYCDLHHNDNNPFYRPNRQIPNPLKVVEGVLGSLVNQGAQLASNLGLNIGITPQRPGGNYGQQYPPHHHHNPHDHHHHHGHHHHHHEHPHGEFGGGSGGYKPGQAVVCDSIECQGQNQYGQGGRPGGGHGGSGGRPGGGQFGGGQGGRPGGGQGGGQFGGGQGGRPGGGQGGGQFGGGQGGRPGGGQFGGGQGGRPGGGQFGGGQGGRPGGGQFGGGTGGRPGGGQFGGEQEENEGQFSGEQGTGGRPGEGQFGGGQGGTGGRPGGGQGGTGGRPGGTGGQFGGGQGGTGGRPGGTGGQFGGEQGGTGGRPGGGQGGTGGQFGGGQGGTGGQFGGSGGRPSGVGDREGAETVQPNNPPIEDIDYEEEGDGEAERPNLTQGNKLSTTTNLPVYDIDIRQKHDDERRRRKRSTESRIPLKEIELFEDENANKIHRKSKAESDVDIRTKNNGAFDVSKVFVLGNLRIARHAVYGPTYYQPLYNDGYRLYPKSFNSNNKFPDRESLSEEDCDETSSENSKEVDDADQNKGKENYELLEKFEFDSAETEKIPSSNSEENINARYSNYHYYPHHRNMFQPPANRIAPVRLYTCVNEPDARYECVPMSSCPTAPILFDKRKHCKWFGSEPHVCCLQEDNDYEDDDNVEILNDGENPVETSDPDKPECGIRGNNIDIRGRRRPGGLILASAIGGVSLRSAASTPWMAAIGQRRRDATTDEEINWYCGGVLISPNLVMTAAHCVTRKNAEMVRLGELDFSSTTDPSTPTDIKIAETTTHPLYESASFYHDLAILRLTEPVTYNQYIKPICLPQNENTFEGSLALLTGWGQMRFGGDRATVLQEVSIEVFNNTYCNNMYQRSPNVNATFPRGIIPSQLCAGDEKGGKDACQGDSGGPLVVNQNGVYVLVGIVSSGVGCGSRNYPGVYTRVSSHMDWIQERISKVAT